MNPGHYQLEQTGQSGQSAQPSQGDHARTAVYGGRECHRILSDDVLQHAEEVVLGGALKAEPINRWGPMGADMDRSQENLSPKDSLSQGHVSPAVLKRVKVSLLAVGVGTLLAYAAFAAYKSYAAFALRAEKRRR